MSKDAQEWTNDEGVKHNLREADDTAHKALKLAEELKDTMLMNPLKVMSKTSTGLATLAIWVGFLLGISCLSGATYLLSKNNIEISTTENTFVVGGVLLGALIGLFLITFFLTFYDLLGNYMLWIGIFVSSLAFNISVFMLIVAIKTRRLV